jgi:glutamyl-tRNA synthetase
MRLRFAPSPTGPLHIGGVRTALYNYLLARKHGGSLILRIEDTDQTRFVSGAEEYIIESLNWLGITFDEGVHIGGPHAPYRQSERKAIYREYVMKLLNEGKAYYAFDTAEELDTMRQRLQESGNSSQQYDHSSRMNMRNAFSLPSEEVSRLLDSGAPYVVRINIPENREILVNDLIRGEVRVQSSSLDDKVLFKSDGLPTYHLANIVDDHLMEITHVVRGEEWLPSAPLHVLLYEYFGWNPPAFAHLPLLLKPDGNGKLSKRDGDRLGFPVFPLQWTDPSTGEQSSGYRESGYLPEAVLNILAFLGWNPGTEQEVFSLEELVQAFSLDKVHKAGARFSPDKAKWFNHHYLSSKSPEELAEMLKNQLAEAGISDGGQNLPKICSLISDRLEFAGDLLNKSRYFFEAPEQYDDETIRKKCKAETPAQLREIADLLAVSGNFSAHWLEDLVKGYLESAAIPLGQVMVPLRICLVGAAKGPHLFDILEILGKDESVSRIRKGLLHIAKTLNII